MRFTCLSVVLISLALSGAGCTVLVDGTLAGRTGTDAAIEMDAAMDMTDAGPPVGACTGMPDGLRCAPEGIVEPFVCVDEVCVLSTCGDGVPDDRDGSMHDPEECDDGNAIPGDGCDADCTFSCLHDIDCSDGEICTGEENCQSTTHACEPGTAPMDGSTCTIMGSTEVAACRSGICRAGACPDGMLDAGEECDPSATPVANDGCEDDCTFTCESDTECQDTDPCNGSESCDVTSHVCSPAAAVPDCDDMDPCTVDSCVTGMGCSNLTVLVDGDSDGHPAITASCGGDDCNDADPLAYPGATEACGATSDLNCDGSSGTMPTFYPDCDGDNYARSGASGTTACVEPAATTGCSGGWTSIAPGTGSTDCLDTSSSARPGQTTYYNTSVTGLAPPYDYNCSGGATPQYITNPRFFVECAFDRAGDCVGDRFYDVTTVPACGATTTLSYCAVRRPFLVDVCSRVTTTTHRVACR